MSMSNPTREPIIDAWAQPMFKADSLPEVVRLFERSGSAHLLATDSAYLPRYYPPQLLHYMKTYGSDKVLFGTNFPQLSFARAVEQVAGLGLPDEARAKFLYGNARRVFQLSSCGDAAR